MHNDIKIGDWVIYDCEETVHRFQGMDAYNGKHGGTVRRATDEEIRNHLGEKPEPIFRKGDTVHHWKHGEGIIFKVWEGNDKYLGCRVTFGGLSINLPINELSFTPYNLVTGGFSQERPVTDIKHGQVIYVKDKNGSWHVGLFGFKGNSIITIFESIGFNNGKGRNQIEFEEIRTENPFA